MLATDLVPTNGATKSERIASYAPATGQLLGTAPVMSADEVHAAMLRAKRAQVSWGALSIEERCERVLRYRDAIIDREEELTDLLSSETGKPRQEALMQEIATTASVATYFCKVAPKLLAPRETPLLLLKHKKSMIHYTPRGVVAVISPWNYPFFLPLRDALIALIAGNSVVIKPSEVTPLIALRAKEVWDRAGLPPDVLQVVTGYGPAGAALIDAHPAFVVFTGGTSTGRRVAAACGERLIPCVMELGGKAPLIACEDADVDKAARAAVFGGFSNSGQICISVERVYANEKIHDALLDRMIERVGALRQGDPAAGSVDVGAIIFPKQIEIAEAHIRDAVSKGARVVAGGKRKEGPGQFFEPTILAGCDHTMTVMNEEIFGPIVPVMKVSSDEEALRLANASHLGLNAYVFSKDRDHAYGVAQRVEAGSVCVNDVLINGGCPEAPFGGVKQSGFGRMMGDESLREMCDVRHILLDRAVLDQTAPAAPIDFPYTDKGLSIARKVVRVVLGGGSLWKRLSSVL
ncbi:MAG: aldehyde dehydrogenase family protein [Polyangiaceae bacterium]